MRSYRVYVDTSVIGGCLDEEFADESLRLIESAKRGRLVLLVSAILAGELGPAPSEVAAIPEQLPPEAVEDVPVNEEVIELRRD